MVLQKENILSEIFMWQELELPSEISARHGHRMLLVEGQFVVLFGSLEDKILSDILVYNPKTEEWNKPVMKGDIPPGRAAFAATVLGSKVIIFGGCVEYSVLCDDLYELDTLTWKWRKIHPKCKGIKKGPCARLGATLTTIDDKMYLFGGMTTENLQIPGNDGRTFFSDLFVLSENDDIYTWEVPVTFREAPGPRESHTALAYKAGNENWLVIFGGTYRTLRLNDVWTLNVDNMAWNKPAVDGNIPEGRSLHSANIVGNKMIIFGGSLRGKSKNLKEIIFKSSNSLACLNLEKMKWETEGIASVYQKPLKRDKHQTVTYNGCIYLFSGRVAKGLPKDVPKQICYRDFWKLEIKNLLEELKFSQDPVKDPQLDIKKENEDPEKNVKELIVEEPVEKMEVEEIKVPEPVIQRPNPVNDATNRRPYLTLDSSKVYVVPNRNQIDKTIIVPPDGGSQTFQKVFIKPSQQMMQEINKVQSSGVFRTQAPRLILNSSPGVQIQRNPHPLLHRGPGEIKVRPHIEAPSVYYIKDGTTVPGNFQRVVSMNNPGENQPKKVLRIIPNAPGQVPYFPVQRCPGVPSNPPQNIRIFHRLPRPQGIPASSQGTPASSQGIPASSQGIPGISNNKTGKPQVISNIAVKLKEGEIFAGKSGVPIKIQGISFKPGIFGKSQQNLQGNLGIPIKVQGKAQEPIEFEENRGKFQESLQVPVKFQENTQVPLRIQKTPQFPVKFQPNPQFPVKVQEKPENLVESLGKIQVDSRIRGRILGVVNKIPATDNRENIENIPGPSEDSMRNIQPGGILYSSPSRKREFSDFESEIQSSKIIKTNSPAEPENSGQYSPASSTTMSMDDDSDRFEIIEEPETQESMSPKVLGIPSNLQVRQIGDGINLSWSAPQDTIGIINYRVLIAQKPQFPGESKPEFNNVYYGTERNCNISGTMLDKCYKDASGCIMFKIGAENNVETGKFMHAKWKPNK